MTPSWMSLLWFALIVALIPAALWLFKRSGMAGAMTRSQALALRQVGSLGLGPQQRIVAVEVGEGEARRWLLLGVTPQQINALHVLDQWPGTSGEPSAGQSAKGGSGGRDGGFGAELAQRLRAGLGAPVSTPSGKPTADRT
ncbi:flagellar biosynthesis protein FliO [Leptothrix cholodnii SP-6]|uniref:Flagellar biosynthesis protein FliO n=1 Tax=Leptothrix cholodnii (strain ATCC 51168 / LMG 8142 / SP-6) TaxID=395495 RepID=B1Y393_LEPCP|nr:flagellar biosynthetic protein FliO [Leptothrix cholodnii]ACB33296.1 flagellar biosynthesis protein FliO [Leptothrix cholodnii SP-6]